ncbi:MAG TPA: hypothetical protein VFK46_05600 [Candidatus Macondimonas sp.]|nr:hypothetical protein [Candidatus Macondimonas sp.]
MRTHRLETTGHTRASARSLDRRDLHRWLVLGSMGLGLTTLAMAPLVQAEDLMDINGQPRWVAALEIPFDMTDGRDAAPRLHFALENHRSLENGRHVASVGYQWVLGDAAQDQRQQGFYAGNEFVYAETGFELDPAPALFYRGEKMVFNDQSRTEFNQLSTGAKGVLVLGALVGVVLAVSNGTSSEGPSSPPPEPEPEPEPAPTPASAAAGVVGQALSPGSIAGFFNNAFSGTGGGGTAP